MPRNTTVFIVDHDEAVLGWCADTIQAFGFDSEAFSTVESFWQSEWKTRAGCVLVECQLAVSEREFASVATVDGDSLQGSAEPEDSSNVDVLGWHGMVLSTKRPAGLDLLERIVRNAAFVPVIMLAHDCSGAMVRSCFLAGAFDCLSKPISELELKHVVGIACSRRNRRREIDKEDSIEPEIQLRIDSLTPREFAVLGEMLRGMSIKQLAARFNISIQTAAKHRARVLSKMRSENEIHLIHLLGRRWQKIYADICM